MKCIKMILAGKRARLELAKQIEKNYPSYNERINLEIRLLSVEIEGMERSITDGNEK